jgi:hypothetical protein
MTPAQFAARYRATAGTVSAGTGIDPMVLLAQWANETAWGTVVAGNNLGNIRCSPTTFCRYATLDDFAAACVATFHNGFYGAVLAAGTAEAQLAAICASPWSSGHYGGNLHPFYDPLEAYEMTPEEHDWLRTLHSSWLVKTSNPTGPDATLLDTWIVARGQIADIQKKVNALTPGGGTDLTPVLNALAALTATVTKIENALKSA